jgi:hypothetical protein
LLRHGTSQGGWKAKGQQENQTAWDASPVFLSYALSVIVPNNCERRNNLPRIHGFLMDLRREWPISEWLRRETFLFAVPFLTTAHSF